MHRRSPYSFFGTAGNHDFDTWEKMLDPAFSFLAGNSCRYQKQHGYSGFLSEGEYERSGIDHRRGA